MTDLPREFLKRMRASLGAEFDSFLKSYENAPQKALRVNTLKISVDDFKKISPFPLSPVPWEESGFLFEGDAPGRTVLHFAGAYYVQEPSAMAVVPELEVKGGERVLDLCSAPGGKGTQIAQYMGGEGVLVLNEVVPSRRDILAENVERMGLKNAVVSCAAPQKLATIFENYFDKILVDAPCSGEGMFKKEPNAIPEWSLENVKRCAERQSEILDAADKMLAGGGRLVYSTCTFAPEEDEGQIENFLAAHPDYRLIKMQKLYPHKTCGEGHFFAVLDKGAGERVSDFKTAPVETPKNNLDALKVYREWEVATLKKPLERVVARGDGIYLVPPLPDFADKSIFQYYIGIGRVDGKNFFPWHSIATRLTSAEAEAIEVDEQTAINYLRGLTFGCPPEIKGWRLVTFHNLPLGWCKAVNGTAKNHLPKGLRI